MPGESGHPVSLYTHILAEPTHSLFPLLPLSTCNPHAKWSSQGTLHRRCPRTLFYSFPFSSKQCQPKPSGLFGATQKSFRDKTRAARMSLGKYHICGAIPHHRNGISSFFQAASSRTCSFQNQAALRFVTHCEISSTQSGIQRGRSSKLQSILQHSSAALSLSRLAYVEI